MKRSLLLFFLMVILLPAIAQKSSVYSLRFKSGDYLPALNNGNLKIPREAVRSRRAFMLVQFFDLPTQKEHDKLKDAGIELLEFIPPNAYMASIPVKVASTSLEDFNIRSIEPIQARHKIVMEPRDEADTGKSPVWNVVYFKSEYADLVRGELILAGARIVDELPEFNVFTIEIASDKIERVAEIIYVSSVGLVDKEPEPDNLSASNASRTNIARSGISGTRNLRGNGIIVGVGDSFTGRLHADIQNRVTEDLSVLDLSLHGSHVTGTLGGNGNINPKHMGIAPEATFVFTNMSNIVTNMSTYYTVDSVRITNNSYGTPYDGSYTINSRNIDLQLADSAYDELLHVFSAGNEGNRGFNSVNYGYTAGKNPLVVGNIDQHDVIAPRSSRGPAKDGRIKPEIVASGTEIVSTLYRSSYGANTGTSMSTPVVTGTAALMYERYKQLHGGMNPNSGLIKALLCNTADDLGNAGPDFTYGFGSVNIRRALKAMENGDYMSDILGAGNTISYSLTVPAGAAALKVMLYWKDPAAATNAAITLVNDLNLSVTTPSSIVYLPWVLNHASGMENNPATRGVDNRNNIEQVTIDAPAGGTYTVTIDGTGMATGVQEFFVVYETIASEIVVTNPYGGQTFVPGDTLTLLWDESAGGAVTIDYTVNNGSTWTNIASGIPAGQRYYDWVTPNMTTGEFKIRISNGAYTGISAGASSIMEVPQNLLATAGSGDSVLLSWDPVGGADSYDVYYLRTSDQSMQYAGNTAAANYVIADIPSEGTWYSVRAKNNAGAVGYRAEAVQVEVVSPEDILGPDCVLTDELLELTLNPNLRNDATGYSWCLGNSSWCYEHVTGFMTLPDEPYKVLAKTRPSFSSGNFCVNVTYASSPAQRYCTSLSTCSPFRLGEEEVLVSELKVIPNPSSYGFTIQTGKIIDGISITNAMGGEVYRRAGINSPELSGVGVELREGVYYLKVRYTDETAEVVKVVKSR